MALTIVSQELGGTGQTAFPSPGTAGNVLTSNGSAWTSAVAAAFDAGTAMLFKQTAAPTGWTKDTTNNNDSALRIVTGTAGSGGSVGFTTALASQTPSGSVSVNVSGLSAGATTLSTAQMPSHTHASGKNAGALYDQSDTIALAGNGGGQWTTGAQGGGGSHSHSMSGSATGTFTGNAINLAVKYVDLIVATKN